MTLPKSLRDIPKGDEENWEADDGGARCYSYDTWKYWTFEHLNNSEFRRIEEPREEMVVERRVEFSGHKSLDLRGSDPGVSLYLWLPDRWRDKIAQLTIREILPGAPEEPMGAIAAERAAHNETRESLAVARKAIGDLQGQAEKCRQRAELAEAKLSELRASSWQAIQEWVAHCNTQGGYDRVQLKVQEPRKSLDRCAPEGKNDDAPDWRLR
jgi:hypothetical protein